MSSVEATGLSASELCPGGDLRCLLEPKSLIYLFFCVYRLRKRTLSVPGGKEKEVNPQRSD